MKAFRSAIAATELLLVFPAVLFMAALFARSVQPQIYEPAHTAAQIVDWYAARPHIGLWVLLSLLPFAVLVTGCVMLLRSWREDAELRQAGRQMLAAVCGHAATVVVAVATLMAAGVLAIVAVHMVME